jgi:hypothetical protein
MRFGKFKGLDISTISDSYLWWLLNRGDLAEPSLGEIRAELTRRAPVVAARAEPASPSRPASSIPACCPMCQTTFTVTVPGGHE